MAKKGHISFIPMESNSQPDYILLRVHESGVSIPIIEVTMSFEDFGHAVTGFFTNIEFIEPKKEKENDK